jgi:KUP system potassium uptake protein
VAASLFAIGVFGAAMFYGDSIITPAISVLSAVEGMTLVAPQLDRWIIPVALVVLTGLFKAQKGGTGSVGAMFGPVMVIWFIVLALLGLHQIALHPAILRAVEPSYAARLHRSCSGHQFRRAWLRFPRVDRR